MEHLEKAGHRADRHAHGGRDRRSGCWPRPPTCARAPLPARDGGADRKLRRREGPGARGRGQACRARARPRHRHLRGPRRLPAPARSASSKAGVDTGRGRVLRRVRPQPRVLHGLRVRGDRPRARPQEPGRGRRALRQPARRGRRAGACRPSAPPSTPSGCWPCCRERAMSGPMSNGQARSSALPSKGRLMEQCNAALAKAGLTVVAVGPGARLQGRDRGLARRRGQLRLVLARSRSSSRAARRISASPART